MAVYRLPRNLTVLAWEDRVSRRRSVLTSNGHWVAGVIRDGLHLDFTNVEFVDFAALARALLLIDRAVRDGILVAVTLPTAAISPDDIGLAGADARSMARQARARGDARAFIRHTGFQDALHAPHWPAGAVRITDADAAGSFDSVHRPEADSGDKPYRLRRIFPFQWLRPLTGERLRAPEFFLATVAGLRGLGLTQADARALSHAVLTELVENVAEHAGGDAGPPLPALVGAVLLNAETFRARCADMPVELGELIESADASDSKVVRLVVGDSGIGLVSSLAPAQARRSVTSGVTSIGGRPLTRHEDTVLYAFDRWSTSRQDSDDVRRGTRGLWRVSRLARDYRGCVLVRTSDVLAGWLFGDRQFGVEIADDRVGIAPGTLLEVSVLTDPARRDRSIPRWQEPDLDSDNRLFLVDCAFDPEHGLGAADRQRLMDAARSIERQHSYTGVLVTIPVHDANRHLSGEAMQSAMRGVLHIAGLIADPTAVVVALPNADPRIVDLCVASIAAEEEAADHLTWQHPHSPVLVLGMYGRPQWCSGPRALRGVLEELTDGGGTLSRAEVERKWRAEDGDPDGPWRTIGEQPHLFRQVDGQLQLRLTPRDALNTLADRTAARLFDRIEHGGPGVLRGLFRAPTLRITNRWINAEQLVGDANDVDVAAFILARKLGQSLTQDTSLVVCGRPPRRNGWPAS